MVADSRVVSGPQVFGELLSALRPEVDATLDALLPADRTPPSRLHAAIRYSIFAGGKRVRPALAILAGEGLGADRSLILPGAAALEMLHTFSLVHDDLPSLDDDDLRRGRATVHREYDEATAVLVGDALLALGLTTLAEQPVEVPADRRAQAVSLVGAAIGTQGMIGGQAADLAAEHQWPEDAISALELIHRRKTGALLTASVRLGGLYAGASPDEDALLGELGQRIGMLFQIGDDILDVEASTEALGKTAGKDAAARKLTYPALFGLEESKLELERISAEALALADSLPVRGLRAEGVLFPSLVAYLVGRDH